MHAAGVLAASQGREDKLGLVLPRSAHRCKQLRRGAAGSVDGRFVQQPHDAYCSAASGCQVAAPGPGGHSRAHCCFKIHGSLQEYDCLAYQCDARKALICALHILQTFAEPRHLQRQFSAFSARHRELSPGRHSFKGRTPDACLLLVQHLLYCLHQGSSGLRP